MYQTSILVASTPRTAVLSLTESLESSKLADRVRDLVRAEDYRSLTVVCRRAMGTGPSLPSSWHFNAEKLSDKQRDILRQLFSLVDKLRIDQRFGRETH